MRDKAPIIIETKSKRVGKGNLQEELDKLGINNNKSHKIFLEEQRLEEERMRVSLDQQLQGKEEKIDRFIRETS